MPQFHWKTALELREWRSGLTSKDGIVGECSSGKG